MSDYDGKYTPYVPPAMPQVIYRRPRQAEQRQPDDMSDAEAVTLMRALLDSIVAAGPAGLRTVLCITDQTALQLLLEQFDALTAQIRAFATPPQDELPRRNNLDRMTVAERAIYDAKRRVDETGCDAKLTFAVMRLQEALNAVSDYVDATLLIPCGVGSGYGYTCLKTTGHTGQHEGPNGVTWGGAEGATP